VGGCGSGGEIGGMHVYVPMNVCLRACVCESSGFYWLHTANQGEKLTSGRLPAF